MPHSSLHVCMDTSDWLQGTTSEEISSSLDSPLLGSKPTLMDRKLRPPHDLNLKCPRCDSSHTKFCYYNNYSLTQPRYFCKACRRYWTKGGTLRSIPVGGGCREKKKSRSKKVDNTDRQYLANCLSSQGSGDSSNFLGAQMSPRGDNNDFVENSWMRPIDYMERKYEELLVGRNYNNYNNYNNNNLADYSYGYNRLNSNFNNICSSISSFGNSNANYDNINNYDRNFGINNFMDQRLLIPYDANDNSNYQNGVTNVKANNPNILSLEWQDQGYNNVYDM